MYPSRNACVAGNPHGGVKTPLRCAVHGCFVGSGLDRSGEVCGCHPLHGRDKSLPYAKQNAVSAQEAAFLYDFQNSLSTGYSPSSLIFFRASTSSGLSSR